MAGVIPATMRAERFYQLHDCPLSVGHLKSCNGSNRDFGDLAKSILQNVRVAHQDR